MWDPINSGLCGADRPVKLFTGRSAPHNPELIRPTFESVFEKHKAMNISCWWRVKWNLQRSTIKSADKKVDMFSQTNNCYTSKLVSKQSKCPGHVSQRRNIRMGRNDSNVGRINSGLCGADRPVFAHISLTHIPFTRDTMDLLFKHHGRTREVKMPHNTAKCWVTESFFSEVFLCQWIMYCHGYDTIHFIFHGWGGWEVSKHRKVCWLKKAPITLEIFAWELF